MHLVGFIIRTSLSTVHAATGHSKIGKCSPDPRNLLNIILITKRIVLLIK